MGETMHHKRSTALDTGFVSSLQTVMVGKRETDTQFLTIPFQSGNRAVLVGEIFENAELLGFIS